MMCPGIHKTRRVSENMPACSDTSISEWNRIATEYSKWRGGELGARGKAFTNIVTDNLLTSVGNLTGKNVLDLGCGDGYLARTFSSKGAHVWGIDGAPNMIQLATSNDILGNIHFQIGDITKKLPYKDDYFDLVVCNMVLMDLEEIDFTINEVARVVKIFGRFVFSIVHPCFYDALGEWIDTTSPAPAHRFRTRYTEKVKYLKKLVGLPSEVLLAHYNRPIQSYIQPLISNNMCIVDFKETSFTRDYLETIGLLQEFMRYHLSANNLIVGAIKLPPEMRMILANNSSAK
jgi:ubiquinone/menaquinone biosynthesis C-methylase UbiE